MPLSLVHANRRKQPVRMRVVMDWLCVAVTEYAERYQFNSCLRKFGEGYKAI